MKIQLTLLILLISSTARADLLTTVTGNLFSRAFDNQFPELLITSPFCCNDLGGGYPDHWGIWTMPTLTSILNEPQTLTADDSGFAFFEEYLTNANPNHAIIFWFKPDTSYSEQIGKGEMFSNRVEQYYTTDVNFDPENGVDLGDEYDLTSLELTYWNYQVFDRVNPESGRSHDFFTVDFELQLFGTAAVPEPSTLLIALIGLSGLFITATRSTTRR